MAAVVGLDGGWRVVIDQRDALKHHVGKEERLVVVPGFWVQEPVSWEGIPSVVERVERYLSKKKIWHKSS